MEITIGSLGAAVKQVRLKNYKTEVGEEPADVELFRSPTDGGSAVGNGIGHLGCHGHILQECGIILDYSAVEVGAADRPWNLHGTRNSAATRKDALSKSVTVPFSINT